MDRIFYRLLQFNFGVRQWLTRRFTPTGLGVLVCLAISAVVGMDTNQSLAYQVFTFLVALLAIATLTRRFSRFRCSAARSLPRFGTVGVPLPYRVILHNQGTQPKRGLQVRETFADNFPSFRDYQRIAHRRKSGFARRRMWLQLLAHKRRAIAPAIEIPELAIEGDTEIMAELLPLRRGRLLFKSLTVTCPDPLGLINACVTRSVPQSVLILPQRYRLPPLQLPGGRRYQSGGVALASSVGDSEEFRALRDYRPGDPQRQIHWKSWAKVGKPIVKETQEEYFVRHALILDTFQAETHSEILEEAVAIASSLACEVQTQDSLLDLMFVGLEAHHFTVGRGLDQTEHMLELLAAVTPCPDQPFESLLPAVQSRFALLSGCICILLAWDEHRQALVEQLQRASIPTLVLVITELPSEVDGPALPDGNFHVLQLGEIQQGLMQL
ncbi:MAG: DUF58 domain-containing protein [Thermosynechococcaceae cyanobacterium]